MTRIRTAWIAWLAGVAVVAAIAWSFVPSRVSVDTAVLARGPMAVTVDEEARTRVRERYTVSAPVAGYLTRISYRAGDLVRRNHAVARILPAPAAPIDARSRSQLEARLDAALDALRQARLRVESARASFEQASRDHDRRRQLALDDVIPAQELEIALTRRQTSEAEAQAAAAAADVAEHDVEAARAALQRSEASRPSASQPVDIGAPRDGAILRVFEESERVVAAGTPLLEIGDPHALEIVADLLSTDAVNINPGARVIIDRWGGDRPLAGRVRLVEPSSFTKVSALGVEEQRVNVTIDFVDLPASSQLGDRFALEVRVVTWEAPDALRLPVGALFRRGDQWAVFKAVGGRAVAEAIRVGHQNRSEAEVVGGLAIGDRVIVHPSERVIDGVRIDIR